MDLICLNCGDTYKRKNKVGAPTKHRYCSKPECQEAKKLEKYMRNRQYTADVPAKIKRQSKRKCMLCKTNFVSESCLDPEYDVWQIETYCDDCKPKIERELKVRNYSNNYLYMDDIRRLTVLFHRTSKFQRRAQNGV